MRAVPVCLYSGSARMSHQPMQVATMVCFIPDTRCLYLTTVDGSGSQHAYSTLLTCTTAIIGTRRWTTQLT
jgi:hypothetical protein